MIGGTAITIDTIVNFIERLVNVFLAITVLGAISFIVYGGFQMATAAGNDAKFQTGKKTLINAMIGLAVILGVGIIVNTIARFAASPESILY